MRAARHVIADAMEVGASLLVEAVARAGENAIRADAQVEGITADRLVGKARLLRELDATGALPDSALPRLAMATGLHRIQLFDVAGRPTASSGADEPGPPPHPPGLAQLLSGVTDEVILGFRRGRFRPGERYGAGVRRAGGGAIVVSVDAADMLALRRDAGIGRLMQDIGDRADIAYLVLQDRQGVVLASRGVAAMSRIDGDPFLEDAIAADGPRSRWVGRDGTDLFETVLPFWVDEDDIGLIRLGVVADAMAVAEARSRRRLAVWAGLLAVVGVGLVAVITVRQNYALLDDAHRRVQTTSSRLLEDMADAVVAVDGERRIRLWNRAAGDLFEVDAGAAMGGELETVLGDAGRFLADALARGVDLRGEAHRCVPPAGRPVDLSVSLSRLPGDAEGTAVAVIQDLTERRALEADLQRRERLSAMGGLAAGVAHEVRNPLNAIAVVAQRLQREFTPTADAEEYAELTGTVRAEVGRVNDIVRQFLQLARPPALELADTDLEALLDDTSRLAGHDAESRGVPVVADVAGIGSARVDAAQLRQAVLNLLVNAVDAVAAAEDRAVDAAVRLRARRTEAGVEIRIDDDGPGIPPETRERIFDLYYTTKASGTGLGLAFVQRVVAEHGGRIDVDTRVGGGTTFIVHLPPQADA